MSADYSDTQVEKDAEYEQAWRDAPESFKRRAAAAGLEADVEPRDGMVMEYDENLSRVSNPGHTPSFYIPDMAESLDTHVDRLVEKYGFDKEKLIREIAEDLKQPMLVEIEKNRALMLGRVVMYLIKSESNNILARCHQLMHAIPRLAVITGFGSMRKSGKACGVSAEWIRRGRDKWCEMLDLPIPVEGRKSDEAREKYHANGLTNHWRKQTVQPNSHLPCLTKNIPTPIRTQPAQHHLRVVTA